MLQLVLLRLLLLVMTTIHAQLILAILQVENVFSLLSMLMTTTNAQLIIAILQLEQFIMM
jgi:hypothetical protein